MINTITKTESTKNNFESEIFQLEVNADLTREEAIENLEKFTEYEAIKAETLLNTGDEDLAEDMAWELVYGE